MSRARAPWSVTPCIELSRRVPSMPSSDQTVLAELFKYFYVYFGSAPRN